MSLAIVARLHALELRVKELEEKHAKPVPMGPSPVEEAIASLEAKANKKPKKKHASKAH